MWQLNYLEKICDNANKVFFISEQGWIFVFGIFTAVLSYFAKNLILEPLLDFRKVKGRIQNKLKYHANKVYNKIDFKEEKIVLSEIRKLSCDIEEAYCAISFRRILVSLKLLISPDDINEVSSWLIFLSNSLNDIESNEEKRKACDIIKEKLKIL